jgi:hypothetical protein
MAAAIRRTVNTNPNVAFIRPELVRLLPQYELIRDCIAGETVVKEQRTKYLPMPNAHDKSPENQERYRAYLLRAVFYNVTRRTVMGLIGQVFGQDPAVKLPAALDPMIADATGTGTSLNQLAEISLGHNIAYSRSGVFVDFPDTSPQGGASAAQVEAGEIRPTMYAYSPMEIINWRVIERGAKEVLALVVLLEGFPISDDGFEIKNAPQFRVLKLDAAGNYVQEIWKEPQPGKWDGLSVPKKGDFRLSETITPTGPDGKPIKEIPFWFIGAQNNDINPDNPNMYDMASLNIAHYRNSADYEESCYVVGQPTPVATGLTEEWVKNVLKGQLAFGSRGGIPLPTGATAELLQAEANTMIKEAMDTKERQMTALGAKLVEQKEVQRTATEASQDKAAENSVLTSCANNVSAAYRSALTYAAWLMGAAGEIEYALNIDFEIAALTPEQVKMAIEAWQKGAITFEEMRADLRRYGLATLDDKEAKAAISKEQIDAMTLAAENDPQFNQPGDGGNPPPSA